MPYSYDARSETLTLTPGVLNPSTSYQFDFSGGIKDFLGARTNATTSPVFTTGLDPAHAATATSPLDTAHTTSIDIPADPFGTLSGSLRSHAQPRSSGFTGGYIILACR